MQASNKVNEFSEYKVFWPAKKVWVSEGQECPERAQTGRFQSPAQITEKENAACARLLAIVSLTMG